MEAQVTRAGDVLVVTLTGFMNFETSEPFRKACLNQFIKHPVIFDMRALSFVGSSGLTNFVDVIREFRGKAVHPVKFCGLNQEFRRLFWASEMQDLEIYGDAVLAHSSFTSPVAAVPMDFSMQDESFDDGSN